MTKEEAKAEINAEKILDEYLRGYKSVIQHGHWVGLRAGLAALLLIEKKSRQRGVTARRTGKGKR